MIDSYNMYIFYAYKKETTEMNSDTLHLWPSLKMNFSWTIRPSQIQEWIKLLSTLLAGFCTSREFLGQPFARLKDVLILYY